MEEIISLNYVYYGRPLLQKFKFSKLDVEMACRDLKSNSSPGSNEAPAVLLKTVSKEFSLPVFVLWRASIDQGVIRPVLLLWS